MICAFITVVAIVLFIDGDCPPEAVLLFFLGIFAEAYFEYKLFLSIKAKFTTWHKESEEKAKSKKEIADLEDQVRIEKLKAELKELKEKNKEN